ncbi:hypothetical protein [Alteribacter aurantiacus]|nr:hypothetical protein [Alteribacter aurantiacus]
MTYNDIFYGESTLDPVLIELIESMPLKRLKGVHQAGAVALFKKE